MSENEGEILDRITAEHYDRGHLTGPIAGCQACLEESRKQTAELEAARAQFGGGGAAAALEALALAQVGRPALALSDEDDEALRPGVAAVTPLLSRQTRVVAPRRPRPVLAPDGATLRDLADTSIHAAMACLNDPHAQAKQEGIVHALVAVAEAVLAVEETVRTGSTGAPGAA